LKDLSLHILDIVQNSISAKARLIEIEIEEDVEKNMFQIRIKDNGCGMTEETAQKALDPFYTSRTTRKVGLGLPLFKQNAEQTGGNLTITSELTKGTTVTATFIHNHLDRPSLGDIVGVMGILIMANPTIDFIYTHSLNNEIAEFDTRPVKEELDEIPIHLPEVIRSLKEMMRNNLKEIHVL